MKLTALIFVLLLSLSASKNIVNSTFVADKVYRYNAPISIIGTISTMQNPFAGLGQYLLPQHTLSRFAGWVSACQWPWLKNRIIKRFIKQYQVNMQEAIVENPEDYPDFNSFFTRQLKPDLRPIVQDKNQIACPVDGYVSQIGKIKKDTLVQAKGSFFNLRDLLGGQERIANMFVDGSFVTLYLSPKDYHRVHMPITGMLQKTIYIPGKLFSVSPKTTLSVPNLFAKNERLVCLFDTEIGPMAIILVGAIIVGSINTTWRQNLPVPAELTTESFENPSILVRGEEMGHFKLGSTVIVLFAKNRMEWLSKLQEDSAVRMGELIGSKIEETVIASR